MPGQVVGLGQRVELNADLLRARNGQEGQTFFPVQHNVGIRVIVQNDDVVLTRPEDQLFVELTVGNGGGRVVRIGNNDRLCTLCHVLRNVVKVQLPVLLGVQRVQTDRCAGHHRAE